MNMSILKMIKEYLKDTMKKAGFKVEGQRYVRVINEQLYQYIIFQGSSGGNQFTINVGIDTLLDKEIESGKCSFATMRLGMLLGQGDVWWTYTEESAMEVVGILSNFLLPKLDECSTYESMYKAMSKYINYLSDTEKEEMNFAFNLYLTKRYNPLTMLCIKLGEYDSALICVKNEINWKKDWMEHYLIDMDRLIAEATIKKYREEWIRSKEECLSKGQKELQELSMIEEKIHKKDCGDVISQMNKTEAQNLENLKKYICYTRKSNF